MKWCRQSGPEFIAHRDTDLLVTDCLDSTQDVALPGWTFLDLCHETISDRIAERHFGTTDNLAVLVTFHDRFDDRVDSQLIDVDVDLHLLGPHPSRYLNAI